MGPAPDGMVACHRDDDKNNNALDNLYWGTPTENMQDALRNGRNFFTNKNACKNGHPWTEKNTYIRKDKGTRQCRQCMLESNRRNRDQTPRAGGLYGGKGVSYVD